MTRAMPPGPRSAALLFSDGLHSVHLTADPANVDIGFRPCHQPAIDVSGQRLESPDSRDGPDELKVIGAQVTAVAQGRGGVLVIEGPPGIGKSRLLTEVMALAEKAGVRTLFGEAFEYQQSVPFFSLFMATLRADPPGRGHRGAARLGARRI